MKLIVCSVFDSKAKAFMMPFFVANANLGVRAFGDVVADNTSGLCRHASDYKLYQVGVFDDNSGAFDPGFKQPEFLANAVDFVPLKKEVVSDEKNNG